VSQVVEADRVGELQSRGGRGPDVVAEPVAGEVAVAVGVDDAGAAGVVFAGGELLPVRERCLAQSPSGPRAGCAVWPAW